MHNTEFLRLTMFHKNIYDMMDMFVFVVKQIYDYFIALLNELSFYK